MSVAWLLSVSGCPAYAVHPDPPEDSTGADDDDGGGPDGDSPAPTSDPTTTAMGFDTSAGESGAASSDTSDAATGPDTSATGTTATSVASGTCGDGVVDPGESCDLSYAQNNDHGACTESCQAAYCGDGLACCYGSVYLRDLVPV